MPDIATFRRLTRSLAMLDAILSPQWEDRTYSFNSRWSANEMMASMRNGCGDHWFAILCPAGIALHGLAHELVHYAPPGLFAALPPEFHRNLLHEPAFQTEFSTFCLWRRIDDKTWHRGPSGYPDGSAEMLGILAGHPEQYLDYADEYFERELRLEDIVSVYRHQPLNRELVGRLNPEVDPNSLQEDMAEIGYPE
jgi:hypothetical protein